MNNISIKPISELLGMNFFIPSYQRGYRWTEQQVIDLLNDINEFSPKEIANSGEETWYCLQPIVVKETDRDRNEWEVIDGQQRLTTTYLILYYLNQRDTEEGRTELFEVEYETREGSANYLKNELGKIEKDDSNIDYFHISIAYQTIKDWFKEKKVEKSFELKFNDSTKVIKSFKSKFNDSTKVIWYETSKEEDSTDIFTRINSGKIPLTNAELIKALFLNSSNFENVDAEKLRLKQLEIASEWDRIEYALQDDSFWYFINKSENNLATRIEFIFNLMSDRKEKDDDYFTFRYFSQKFRIKSENEINDNWQKIKTYFQTLEEWFNDRELYHKIGYLITVGKDIKLIIQQKPDKTKTEFRNWLDNQISVAIKSKKTIEELEYGADNSQLRKILLLHNIVATLKSEDVSLRFPFEKYKDKRYGGWSLEHIHAQNSEDITKLEEFKEWLKALKKNELPVGIQQGIKEVDENTEQDKISQLVAEISNWFGESEIHSIENMALLSRNDNAKLNNGLFPVKRGRIIQLEKNGAFIPLATKKVFQKYYEGCTKQLSKWEDGDRAAYLEDIKGTLKDYLPQPTFVENEQ